MWHESGVVYGFLLEEQQAQAVVQGHFENAAAGKAAGKAAAGSRCQGDRTRRILKCRLNQLLIVVVQMDMKQWNPSSADGREKG